MRQRSAVVGLALVLLLTGSLLSGGPSGAAARRDPAPTSLSLTGPATARLGETVQVVASLTSAGNPVVGVPVVLERRVDGVWTQVTSTVTGADGAAAYDVTVEATTGLRASYAGDAERAPAVSDVLTVTAQRWPTRVTLTGPSTLVDETSATLTVRWTTTDGAPVAGTVRLDRRTRHGRWRTWSRLRTDAGGVATVAVSPRVDTWWRVWAPGTSRYLADLSPTLSIDNLPPGSPISYPRAAPHPHSTAAQARATGRGANVDVSRVPTSVWNQMTGISWHRGCPVGRSGLRYLRLNYWGYDGYRHRGSLVVNAGAANRTKEAFEDLYAAEVPFRRMYLVDRFGYSRRSGGGDDYASMRAGNTSAFNCRWVTGRPGVRSPHSWGFALDLNTWENPYHSAQGWLPNRWWAHRAYGRYAWRSGRHTVVRIMRDHGFHWTYGTEDSQHFDAPGHRTTCPGVCD